MAHPSRTNATLIPVFLILTSVLAACEITEDPLEPVAGQLRIDVGPEEIQPSWILFLPDGGEITGTGDSLLVDVPSGDYELVWGPAEDWASPTPNPVELSFAKSSTETVVGNYGRIRGPKGNVAVQPSPKDLKAPWVLTGPDGFYALGDGNDVLRGRAAGEYTVFWREIDGFVTPDPTTALLEDNGTLHFDVTYVTREVPSGSIVVSIDPDGIAPSWTVTGGDGSSFTGSGDGAIENLPSMQYSIEFGPVDGFVTPGSRSGLLEAGGTLQFAATYEAVGPQPATLIIDATPNTLEAPWSLARTEGGSWSGRGDAKLSELSAGEYTLSWEGVPGWITPDPRTETVVLAEGQSATISGVYVEEAPAPGAVAIDVQPGDVDAGWTLTGPSGFATGGTGDAVLPDLEPGDYTVTWGTVEGWYGPDPGQATRSLSAGGTVTFEGSYQPIVVVTTPAIPSADEWTDHGEIFAAGAEGDWDLYLWGGFAASAVKRNGTWLLYYQGSDGYDDTEETVTHRAIGVATSTDGIHFQKHGASPVITWLPTNGVEEGAASGGAWVSDAGEVHVYYGANTFTTAGLVSADARLASSLDGLTFSDQGIVLDHARAAVWGSGDEIFPVIGFQAGETWFSYYIPNNATASRGHLGVAWGPDRKSLTSTAEVRAEGSSVPAWGPAGWARLSDSSYAIFVSNRADGHFNGEHVDVYTVDPASPASFTGPVETYAFANANKSTVLLDRETDTWYLYYRNADASAYGVRTAPIVLR